MESIDNKSNKYQELIAELKAEIEFDFSSIRDEFDPFKRLAWLIEKQERFNRQLNLPSDIQEILCQSDIDRLILAQDCEHFLRDYYELTCKYGFPHMLIYNGLQSYICKMLMDTIAKSEQNDTYFKIALSDKKSRDALENWLGFKEKKLTVHQPENGLFITLDNLKIARKKLENPKLDRGDILGQVTDAFIMGELLLGQLLSLYGRILFDQDYAEKILLQYDREAKEKAKNNSVATSLPELKHELSELLNLKDDTARDEAVQAFIEELLRCNQKVKFPSADAKRLRELLKKGKGLGFLGYTNVLHSLDRWLAFSYEDHASEELIEVGRNFEKKIDRKWLFSEHAGPNISITVPLKEGNEIKLKDVLIREHMSPFIAKLRELNKMRPLYVHAADKNFIHQTNLENIHNGAKIILDTFIGLWEDSQITIFPPVIMIRRILLIESNLFRMDYIPEGSESSLKCIRVVAKDLLSFTRLLGQEAYLLSKGEKGWKAYDIILFPIDERFQEAK